ncbi:PCMD domain-containing protein [Myroides odoratimimus]|uniref:PCMD domain-containing protein n=1 Tax=Myroides odoratimimus TaxID=76832 RepID=UPI000280A84B|nr:PCMD domain-containing protein [Myroides odoratimimus]EKB04463.1 hypothetical protein HMPREF9711_01792 [Myroides odoratimimus CCUG 3837]
MRINYLLFALLTTIGITFSSCIKDEALNAEADILTATISKEDMTGSVRIENSRITFSIRYEADITKQAPEFTLTEGATINPASGTERNFSQPQTYTVTSQDGKSQKLYIVTFNPTELSTQYNFDNYEFQLDERGRPEKWYSFFELDDNNTKTFPWANANPSFSLTAGGKTADQYPTTVEINGYDGSALKVQTESTGMLGAMFGKPIAAGNMFLGSYDPGPAFDNPLLTLQLGIPFNKIPVSIIGKINYVAGPRNQTNKDGSIKLDKEGKPLYEKVYINGKEVNKDELKDQFDIYAIFFENELEGQPFHLDGTNKFTHPNIIAIARIDQTKTSNTNGWTSFSIPFKTLENKKIDSELLKNNKYSITILSTSSYKGDDFTGAIGSTLLVDNLEIIYEKN